MSFQIKPTHKSMKPIEEPIKIYLEPKFKSLKKDYIDLPQKAPQNVTSGSGSGMAIRSTFGARSDAL